MKRTFRKKSLALLLLTVSLSGIVGCQTGVQPGSSVSDGFPGASFVAEDRIVATMGTVSLAQKEVLNYLQILDPAVVSSALDGEGALEEVVKGVALRKNVISRANSENWLDRAGVKTKIEEARRDVVYTRYVSEKSEQLPADYPDDATVARVYESNKQQPVIAGKSMQDVTPFLRQLIRKRQQQAKQQNYINGLVSSNPVNVDIKKLVDFNRLSREQRQLEAERLKEPAAQMGVLTAELGLVQQSLDSMDPAELQKLVNNSAQLQQYVARLMIKFFVLKEAIAEKFNARPEVSNQMEQAGLQAMYTSYMEAWSAPESDFPGAALVGEAYQKKLEALILKDRYHLANIIIKNSGDSAADAIKAQQAADSAGAAGADFAALARHYSDQAESAQKGGDIGWVDSQILAPELNQAILGNQPGAIIGPVQYAWGWQILKLIEHQPERPQTLEEARPALVAALRKQRRAEKAKEIIEQLLAADPITVDKDALEQLRQQLAG